MPIHELLQHWQSTHFGDKNGLTLSRTYIEPEIIKKFGNKPKLNHSILSKDKEVFGTSAFAPLL
jgi:hypothetical protein